MFTEIRIYFEGDKGLKPGFAAFFAELKTRATERRCKMELIATGGQPQRDFGIALAKHPNAWNILLRDSEGPYDADLSASLCREQGWPASQASSIFWMVEIMESWFHADKDRVEQYYGHGFRRAALKPNSNVEEIPKLDVLSGLKAATKDTQKGTYHKTRHAPKLLEKIRPAQIQAASPNCRRLFEAAPLSCDPFKATYV